MTLNHQFRQPDRAADHMAAFEEVVAATPEAVAMRYPARKNRHAAVTYGELGQRYETYTKALVRAGLRRGMRTCLMVPPGPELAALAFALARLGVVPVLIDPGIDKAMLRTCLAEVEPQAFIGVPLAHAGRVVLGWARRSVTIPITVGRRWFWGGATLDELCSAAAADPTPTAERDRDALAAIAFTSGSTGVPKATEYRFGQMSAQVRLARAVFPLEPGMVGMSAFPPFTLAGPSLGLTMIVPNLNPIRPANADPARLVDEIERFGVVGMFASPALLDTLSRHCDARGIVLGSLRAVSSAGASLDPRIAERMRRCLPEDALLYSAYGATECLPVSAIESRELLGEPRRMSERGAGTCVGRPLPENNVRVIEISDGPIDTWSDRLLVPPGEIGEITVAGPSVSERYFGRPDLTELAKIRAAEGVVHRIGDVGWRDERGRLWFCGRKSQRVRTPGGDLHTEQVEPIANTVTGVRRSALVGVGTAGAHIPVLCVEPERGLPRARRKHVAVEVREVLAGYEHSRMVQRILFHPGFPVDIRHNAKIGRERLAQWANRRPR